ERGRITNSVCGISAALKPTLTAAQCTQGVRIAAGPPAVTILGFRASATLAHYLWYNLRKVKPDVAVYMRSGSVTFDDLLLSDRKTLLIPISFPRYSQELLDIAAFGREAGFRSLGLTDNELSPLVPLCTQTLFVGVGEVSFTDFHAAPVALLNALVAEVAARSSTRALSRLKQLDDLAADRGYLFRPRRKGAELSSGSSSGSTASRLAKTLTGGRS